MPAFAPLEYLSAEIRTNHFRDEETIDDKKKMQISSFGSGAGSQPMSLKAIVLNKLASDIDVSDQTEAESYLMYPI